MARCRGARAQRALICGSKTTSVDLLEVEAAEDSSARSDSSARTGSSDTFDAFDGLDSFGSVSSDRGAGSGLTEEVSE